MNYDDLTYKTNVHQAQAKNYVVAYNKPIGLLINFGSESLQVKKVYNKKYQTQDNIMEIKKILDS